MKITVKMNDAKKQKNVTYPVLMQNKNQGSIVLFTSATSGMKVFSPYPYPNHVTYKMEDNWIDSNDTHHWELFDGTITMQNDADQL